MIRQIAEYGKFAYFIIYEIKLLKLYKTCNYNKEAVYNHTKKYTFLRNPDPLKKISLFTIFCRFILTFPM